MLGLNPLVVSSTVLFVLLCLLHVTGLTKKLTLVEFYYQYIPSSVEMCSDSERLGYSINMIEVEIGGGTTLLTFSAKVGLCSLPTLGIVLLAPLFAGHL